jgi:2-haloacid dehalogenase
MPPTWVLFDLNGTLVDPSVVAQPLGDSSADEALVQVALDDAIAQAMVSTLTGRMAPFTDMLEAAVRRRLRQAGRDESVAAEGLELLGTMPAYLEAPAALERLRGVGLHLAVLSQSAAEAADRVLRFAGLRDRLELVMSAQDAGAYKPDPRPYRMALERMGAEPADACFVATHWWDVHGAKAVGMRTGWVARRERALLETVPAPDYTGRDLAEVAGAIVDDLEA